MDGNFQTLGFGGLEGGLENGDVTTGRIAAEIDAYYALGTVLECEVNDGEGGGEVITAVYGKDEVCFHGVGFIEC